MFDGALPDHPNPAPAPGVGPGLAFQLPPNPYYQLIRTLRRVDPAMLCGRAMGRIKSGHGDIGLSHLMDRNLTDREMRRR